MPRRRNPLRSCLTAALFVVGAFFVLGMVGLRALGHGQTPSADSTPVATVQPTHQWSNPTTTDNSSTGAVPSSIPTMPGDDASSVPGAGASASTTPNVSSTPTASTGAGYQNADYQVPQVDTNPPALPEPETYGEAEDLLTSNRLYDQTVAKPVQCQMSDIDLSRASKDQLQSHLNELTGCLMRVWGPTLKSAGYTAVRPSVTIYSGSVTTQCGKLPDENAVYCGADQQIYYAADLPDLIPSELQNSKFITESVIAHEFGHAVQARSGMLISESALADQAESKSTQYSLSRRLEQQADCFAGEFLSSISQSTGMTTTDLTNIQKLFYSFGDDQLTGNPYVVGNHGHGEDRAGWMNSGMTTPQLGRACNTFTAPATSVR